MTPISPLSPQPLPDRSKQRPWIAFFIDNLTALLRARSDLFISTNLTWFPRANEPEVFATPEVMVVFGRPNARRSSYRQWEEDDVPVTVAFDIPYPGQSLHEVLDKIDVYREDGTEEYYLYEPERNNLMVMARKNGRLRRVEDVTGFVSPRLGIRFDLSGPEMVVYGPDGQRFLSFEELPVEGKRE